MAIRPMLVLLLLCYFSHTEGYIVPRPILVHAIFRHGDRTPDPTSNYPSDPYINESYEPYGLGQLTNLGKRTEYNLGSFLRNRYGNLVGRSYSPNVVSARSTETDRTKMSLQLVLAGLFPPSYGEVWNPLLNWQPIAYDTTPIAQDELLFGLYNPEWAIAYGAFIQNLTQQGYFDQYQDLFDYLSEKTGAPVSDTFSVFGLYFTLTAQQEWGFELPEWTEQVYPDILREITRLQYGLLVGNDDLKRIFSGRLLRKIVEDTQSKISGIIPQERSIFLYSGHEINVGTTLAALGISLLEVPSYGATVLFEVHQIGNVYGIQLFYKKGKENTAIPLTIPGCSLFCPLDDFISLVDQYFPDSLS